LNSFSDISRLLILNTDSYKASHWLQYPPGTQTVFSYIEARGGSLPYTVFFGLQALLKDAVVGEAPESDGTVKGGTVVTAIVAGGEEVFLLGSREIAAGSELDVYSEASPLGAAILGLAEGEKTSYTAPNGREISVEIVKVETYNGQ